MMERHEEIPLLSNYQDSDPEAVEALRYALKTRHHAWELVQSGQDLIERVNPDIEAALNSLELTSVRDEEYGSVTLAKNTPRSKFDKMKLKTYLLEKGVGVDVIKEAMEHATSEGKAPKSEYSVRYSASD